MPGPPAQSHEKNDAKDPARQARQHGRARNEKQPAAEEREHARERYRVLPLALQSPFG